MAWRAAVTSKHSILEYYDAEKLSDLYPQLPDEYDVSEIRIYYVIYPPVSEEENHDDR